VKKTKKLKRNLEVLAFNSLSRLARCLPRRSGLRLFSTIGGGAGRIFRKDRARALANLALAFPGTPEPVRRALAAAVFKTVGRNFYEFLTLEGSSPQRLETLVQRVEGQERMDEAIAMGKGVIAITGHIGCWELLAGYYAARGHPVSVVGRELWEKRLNERLLKIRRSLGYHTIDRDSGGKEMMRALRNRHLLAVLIDQHTRVSGTYVPFFDRPAYTPVGVAKLALVSGAPIVPIAIYMTHHGRHEIRVLAPVDKPDAALDRDARIRELTRRCSLAVEELVRYDPKQWVWFHDRWRTNEGGMSSDDAVH
jgi:KDO2-lipid IV(A) lauroyltransferase